ncbi:cobalt-precorrin 5A hydrolase [Trichlorobacter lovleyi]|jgi:Cobalamin biosynthesis protein CbiG|uniref:Cobalamin (Vitamin B12) biosynthesis CbiG protein n=1 Tax=Trichlorobacter lovleyi (strain ATCC BAA-1151 / DSM 17278 / SZ) TaxID=398767 RepID=B3EBR7_TRIL1|nr:cobalamin biosynthesis protein [Trichlorobacter lovleyi]ACD97349.1 cobalamin (vitamin B12) biosynthesis CbiG protein [Trichlorobacter lovleyi SZ]
MKTALITLSAEGLALLQKIRSFEPEADLYVHHAVTDLPTDAIPFSAVIPLTAEIFQRYRELVYAAPAGVVVRALAPVLQHKLSDPAVVVTDLHGRWMVSLLSGHEGGANDCALRLANLIGAEPVITTSSEALKRIIVGIGCRRGTSAERIMAAITEGVQLAGCRMEQVRLLASADLKADEKGLLEAASRLDIPLRIIPSDEIRHTARRFGHSDFVQAKVRLPAVAEPAALLAGRRTQLLLPKTIIQGVTVAVAQEGCLS